MLGCTFCVAIIRVPASICAGLGGMIGRAELISQRASEVAGLDICQSFNALHIFCRILGLAKAKIEPQNAPTAGPTRGVTSVEIRDVISERAQPSPARLSARG